MFTETEKIHTVFRLREVEDGIQLSDRLELHFLELGKILPNTPVEHLDPVEKLAAYLKFAGDETKEDYIQNLIQSGGDAIKMTEQLFRALTEDEMPMRETNSNLSLSWTATLSSPLPGKRELPRESWKAVPKELKWVKNGT